MRKRSAVTREVLIRAAAEAFERNSFGETRLEDVVAGHDVSKGALYFHFPSKEALAAAVIDVAYAPWPQRLARLRTVHPRAMTRLVAVGQEVIDAYRNEVGMRAGLRLMSEVTSGAPSLPRPLTGWLAAVEGLLTEADEQGDLLPGTDIPRSARLILSGFTGLPRIPRAADPGALPGPADPPAHAELAELAADMNAFWLALLPGLVHDECRAVLAPVLIRSPLSS
ncbi:TetR/AcrR family transcriptional regulator [Streptomyces sp. NPDC000594]|uniref:TetR/AcrR family transcriptional regulator n=1 Tax=Streptomyces sp. NPDC000594 TaxID=3154261 RepID=UPI00333378EE